MKKRSLFWHLLPSYWIITAVAITAVTFYAFHAMSNLYFHALEKDIHTRALLLSEHIAPLIQKSDYAAIDAYCKKMGPISATRFTITHPDGSVLGDSEEDPAKMEYHGDRPEIRKAFLGEVGVHRRYSRTIKQEMMYIAVPLTDSNHKILCAVRASLPMNAVQKELHSMTPRVALAAFLSAVVALFVCIIVVKRITTPLHGMSLAASQFAEGDFNHRIPSQQAIEFNELGESLNTMSEQLNHTLSTLSQQRNEQQAVLSSMNEGVLAVDQRERVLHMNRIAGKILGVDPATAKRELIQQTVRFTNLQEFIKAVLGSKKSISLDLTLIGPEEKQIQAYGSVLKNAEDQPIGALIVLRDMTQIRHLETVRSDFVANVSHELKTPITSIKGFVETLLSDDWNHDKDTRHFLEIINQQAGRLNAIIDDLLSLSRLEQKDGRVLKTPSPLCPVLDNAINLCQLQAKKKNILIETKCLDGLTLNINAPLIEQALVNLIVNAIKYSEPEQTIKVNAQENEDTVTITVADSGFGIEQKHLGRLFERFYRVDTARSRKLGGTGLGLSIVNHIIQAHDGHIHVESCLGKGTTFTITLNKT